MARTPALFIDGKFKSPAADQRGKTLSCKGLVAAHRQTDREPCLRFCAILSAKIGLLPPRIARNGLISETGSLLTAPSSRESAANLGDSKRRLGHNCKPKPFVWTADPDRMTLPGGSSRGLQRRSRWRPVGQAISRAAAAIIGRAYLEL